MFNQTPGSITNKNINLGKSPLILKRTFSIQTPLKINDENNSSMDIDSSPHSDNNSSMDIDSNNSDNNSQSDRTERISEIVNSKYIELDDKISQLNSDMDRTIAEKSRLIPDGTYEILDGIFYKYDRLHKVIEDAEKGPEGYENAYQTSRAARELDINQRTAEINTLLGDKDIPESFAQQVEDLKKNLDSIKKEHEICKEFSNSLNEELKLSDDNNTPEQSKPSADAVSPGDNPESKSQSPIDYVLEKQQCDPYDFTDDFE